jgi:rare lipoprotein A (peptidoglycan hydrolase)
LLRAPSSCRLRSANDPGLDEGDSGGKTGSDRWCWIGGGFRRSECEPGVASKAGGEPDGRSLVRSGWAGRASPAVDIVRIKSKGTGIASFYSTGIKTANGEHFDPGQLTAAHRTLPFGTRLQVTNMETGKTVMVRVNDRGPYIDGRVLDLSRYAAESLGIIDQGVAKVHMAIVQ